MNMGKKNTEYDEAKILNVSFSDNMILLLRKPECKVRLPSYLHSAGYKRFFLNGLIFAPSPRDYNVNTKGSSGREDYACL